MYPKQYIYWPSSRGLDFRVQGFRFVSLHRRRKDGGLDAPGDDDDHLGPPPLGTPPGLTSPGQRKGYFVLPTAVQAFGS